jgi:predicted DNA-binding transcriptional regulator AlpA
VIERSLPQLSRTSAALRSTPSRQAIPSDLSRLLTAKELEDILQIDAKTIYGYVRRGLIPYVRIQSNVRFRRREIVEWVNSQSYRPRSGGNRKR